MSENVIPQPFKIKKYINHFDCLDDLIAQYEYLLNNDAEREKHINIFNENRNSLLKEQFFKKNLCEQIEEHIHFIEKTLKSADKDEKQYYEKQYLDIMEKYKLNHSLKIKIDELLNTKT